MKVCTIIVSYNFEKWIQPCLDSLRKSSVVTTVLVIDNASSDNTCETITRDYPEVVLIQNGDNLGFGKANNIGFKYAVENDFDYVFLLNQDAWIESDTLQKLIDISASNPDFGIISPIHLNGAGEKPDFGFSVYTGIKSKNETINLSPRLIECNFINAALWLMPISLVKKVGGFAPIFPHYGEDMNYAQRVRYFNMKIGFVAGAFGYHDREFRKVDRQKFFYTEYIYFLSEAVNILYPSFKAFGYSVLASIKKSLVSLFKGKINDCIEYIKIVFRLSGKSASIRSARKVTRSEVGAYLK